MIPNCQVTFNGTDVTSYLVSYSREQIICTGVTTASFVFDRTFKQDYDPDPYDVIRVYESNIKKGTFYVSNTTVAPLVGTITVDCQDESKKLMDYFIASSYTIDYYSTGRYWMEKFLVEAGASYQFDVDALDTGSPLSNNTTLGYEACYDILMSLVQQSGWHFIADENNVIHIGKLDIDVETHDIVLPGTNTILSIKTTQDDSILRNRVVVWGSGNEDNEEWVFAEAKIYTPYNYDQSDLRTSVLSSGNIYNSGNANILANRILKETSHIKYTKEVEIAGFIDTIVGDSAYLETKPYSGWCLVTSIDVRASSQGVITMLTLDERCPRLYAYFGYRERYVYIGTAGSGVWRKPFSINGWSNYSDGLLDLNVTDLAINKSTLACVTADGSLYRRRTIDGAWWTVNPGEFRVTMSGVASIQVIPSGMTQAGVMASGLIYSDSDVICLACDINRATNDLLAVHTIKDMLVQVSGTFMPVTPTGVMYVASPVDGVIPQSDWVAYSGQFWHSWVTTLSSDGAYATEEIIVNGSNDVYAYDIATDGFDVFVVCLAKIPSPPVRYNLQNPFIPSLVNVSNFEFSFPDGWYLGYTYEDWGMIEAYNITYTSVAGGFTDLPLRTDFPSGTLKYPNGTTCTYTLNNTYRFSTQDSRFGQLWWGFYTYGGPWGNLFGAILAWDATRTIRMVFDTGNESSYTTTLDGFPPDRGRLQGVNSGAGISIFADTSPPPKTGANFMMDASANEIWVEQGIIQDNGQTVYVTYKFKFVSETENTNRNRLIHGVAKRTDQGDYIMLARTPIVTHIEASQNNPLVAFGGNTEQGLGFLQLFPYGYADEIINVYTELRVPDPVDPYQVVLDPTIDLGISTVTSGMVSNKAYIPDARVFYWLDTGEDHLYIGFPKAVPSGMGDQVVLSGGSSLYLIDYYDDTENDLLDPENVDYIMLPVTASGVTPSGVTLTHLETNNMDDVPFIFASSNDVPAMFFEKRGRVAGSFETDFVLYTLNIPNAEITCIRVDDKL